MRRFLQSAKYASNGLRHVTRTQRNFRNHAAIGGVALLLALLLDVSTPELAAIIAVSGLVLCMEVMNSAVEALADFVHPEHAPAIGLVKDMAAGAVMLAALFSGAIGLVIFTPRLAALLGLG